MWCWRGLTRTVSWKATTKEDKARQEVFWNTTLAPDDISRLFEPKVLTGFERWEAEAVVAGAPKPVGRIAANDNLLIKGNNLLALHSLKARYAGAVKLIYIDPPYNTGSDGFRYNDRFNHSAWLTFMRNRLEVAEDLLRRDGAIFVNLDDVEAHYCKVLMDEVFGRENFVANVIWRKNYSPKSSGKDFSTDHDHIFIYSVRKSAFVPNLMPRTDKTDKAYKNPDRDPRGPWKPADLSARNFYSEGTYAITTPSGRFIEGPPNGRYWTVSEDNFKSLVNRGEIWWGKKKDAIPQRKKFLTEVKDGLNPQTIWSYRGGRPHARSQARAHWAASRHTICYAQARIPIASHPAYCHQPRRPRAGLLCRIRHDRRSGTEDGPPLDCCRTDGLHL